MQFAELSDNTELSFQFQSKQVRVHASDHHNNKHN